MLFLCGFARKYFITKCKNFTFKILKPANCAMAAQTGPHFPTQWDKFRVQKSGLEINIDFPTSLHE